MTGNLEVNDKDVQFLYAVTNYVLEPNRENKQKFMRYFYNKDKSEIEDLKERLLKVDVKEFEQE